MKKLSFGFILKKIAVFMIWVNETGFIVSGNGQKHHFKIQETMPSTGCSSYDFCPIVTKEEVRQR